MIRFPGWDPTEILVVIRAGNREAFARQSWAALVNLAEAPSTIERLVGGRAGEVDAAEPTS
jgi:hypothetical protein